MVEIAFNVVSQTADSSLGDSIVEDFSKNFTDIFCAEIFLDQSFWYDDSLIDTANIDFFMSNINHTG